MNRQSNNSARASRFFVHFFPSLHDYDRKMPYFTFYSGHKQTTAKFLSLPELEYNNNNYNLITYIAQVFIKMNKCALH